MLYQKMKKVSLMLPILAVNNSENLLQIPSQTILLLRRRIVGSTLHGKSVGDRGGNE